MAQVGQKYYIIVHAYHHVVGEIEEVLGRRDFILRNVCKVHSCGRDWTSFFRDGFKSDTKYDVLPDGTEALGSQILIPWNHEIPTSKS